MKQTGLDWFMLDGPEFVHSDACAITTMPEFTLQNWANRKLLGVEAAGKGSRRMYSASHIAVITFAREMVSIGFETGLAIDVAAGVYKALLRRAIDEKKAGTSARDCERAVLGSLAFIRPDKEKFKHRVDFYDFEAKVLPVDRSVIFLPAGPLLAKSITAALKVEAAKRKANNLSAAVGAAT